jgi:hypothetical protein
MISKPLQSPPLGRAFGGAAAAHESSLSGGQERDAYAAVGDPRRRATFVMLGGTSFMTRLVTPWAGVAR